MQYLKVSDKRLSPDTVRVTHLALIIQPETGGEVRKLERRWGTSSGDRELTRGASLPLILAITIIDIAKLLPLEGGLALTLALDAYESIARAGVRP